MNPKQLEIISADEILEQYLGNTGKNSVNLNFHRPQKFINHLLFSFN
jgi:hypothetical protein